MRVPGIIEWPAGITAGSTTNAPAVTTDIFPTVLGWAGAEVPADRVMDGRDLSGITRGLSDDRQAPIGFESQYQIAWTDDRYKLVYVPSQDFGKLRNYRMGQNPETSFVFELYDIVDDPAETDNLATIHPEIVARMSGQLQRWRKSVALSIEGDEKSAAEVLQSPD